jgi:hypothetical protein
LFWITGIAGLAMAVKQRKKPLFFIIMLSTTLLLYIVVLLPTYYYLVYFAVPLAFGTGYLLLSIKRRAVAMAALIIMLLFAASRSLPSGLQSPMHDQHADKQELLFSKHRQEINAFFSDQPVVLVGGDFGHQYQFYIDKPIIRSCGLENFRATKALVTNLPDTRCAGETAAIERDWIEEVMITGKSENITLYSLKGNKAFINGPS